MPKFRIVRNYPVNNLKPGEWFRSEHDIPFFYRIEKPFALSPHFLVSSFYRGKFLMKRPYQMEGNVSAYINKNRLS